MHRVAYQPLIALGVLLTACGSPAVAPPDDHVEAGVDAGAAPADAGVPQSHEDKSTACVGQFGNALTAGFGRIDGTLIAVVKPSDTHCPQSSRDHVVLEIQMNGGVYRLLVNVHSTQGSPDVFLGETDAVLPGGAWQEGWHTNVQVDYPTTFGLHSTAFVTHPPDELAQLVSDRLALGAHVSVFAQTQGGPQYSSGAHLVHRNGHQDDGAVVISPESATPHFLLFHFDEQTF